MIVSRRPVRTTGELVDAIKAAIPAPARRRGGHPARRTFQAIRMEVNRELQNLAEGLDESVHLLTPAGRVLVLAYHSLEDRLVKRRFAEWAGRGSGAPPVLPGPAERDAVMRLLTRRPLRPSPEEVAENPRAVSARLRAAEKRT
jgi:16S rRNA (cytosine1402-N4)-methyltransferase